MIESSSFFLLLNESQETSATPCSDDLELFTDVELHFNEASKGQINNETDKVDAPKDIWASVIVLFVLPRQFIKSKSA